MSHLRAPKKFYGWLAAICICLLVGTILYLCRERLSFHFFTAFIYPLWLLCASVVTFAFYGFDKLQAKRDGGRVPEIVLHLLSLAGGFIGGWAGRAVFRHKTRKTAFLVVLVLATIVHAALIVYIFVLR